MPLGVFSAPTVWWGAKTAEREEKKYTCRGAHPLLGDSPLNPQTQVTLIAPGYLAFFVSFLGDDVSFAAAVAVVVVVATEAEEEEDGAPP